MKSIPCVRSAHLAVYVNALRDVGAPVERALAKAKLPGVLPESPDALLPLLPALRFVTAMGRREGIDNLGLRAAEKLRLADLSPTFHMVASQQPTLHGALTLLCQLAPLENPAVRLSLLPDGENTKVLSVLDLRCSNEDLRFSEWNQNLAIITVVREFAGLSWTPAEMAFSSDLPLSSPLVGERFPNTRLLTGQATAWVSVPNRLLAQTRGEIQSRRPSDNAIAPDCSAEYDFVDSLRRVLRSYVGAGCDSRVGVPKIELAAEIAGCSVRTLQRRLGGHLLHYSDIVQQTQLEAAADLLRNPDVTTLDVAYAVGYEHPSSFSRAFRRFAGMTPREYRKHHASH